MLKFNTVRTVIGLLLVLTLVLTACGGTTDNGSPAAPTAEQAEEPTPTTEAAPENAAPPGGDMPAQIPDVAENAPEFAGTVAGAISGEIDSVSWDGTCVGDNVNYTIDASGSPTTITLALTIPNGTAAGVYPLDPGTGSAVNMVVSVAQGESAAYNQIVEGLLRLDSVAEAEGEFLRGAALITLQDAAATGTVTLTIAFNFEVTAAMMCAG